jgi:FHA domain
MSVKPTSFNDDEDPDATARLPVADLASSLEETAEATSSTDVFPVPVVPVGTLELAERLREVERGLDEKTGRAHELEVQLRDARERQVTLESALAESGARQSTLEAQLAEARTYAQQQTQFALECRAAAIRRHDEDIADLRRTSERRLEALTSWQGFRAVSDALLAEAEARHLLLESQVALLGASLRAMEEQRAAAPPPGPAAEQAPDPALTAELAALKSEVGTLQSELAAARERQQELEQQAESAAARARHLEGEIHASELMFGDSASSTVRRDPGDTGNEPLTPEPQADVPLRVLVRQGEAGQVVHPIGRHTTIGRTPDNDIQIDATNVSRRHAVLLTSPGQCIVEDLNSTNGVHVNGRRVLRERLHDGDIVTIGKTEFRFEELS